MKLLIILSKNLRLALCSLGMLPTLLFALDSDQNLPIKVQADAAIVDETKGSSIYTGAVIIQQGTLELKADEVKVLTAEGAVIQIIAKANSQSDARAHYQQQINDSMDLVIADAKKIIYFVQEKRLHLSGNASLKQGTDMYRGELLYYDLGLGIVNLKSGGGVDRVNMTISPRHSSK